MQTESAKSPHLFLYIDLLKFDFPVVFAEPVRSDQFFAVLHFHLCPPLTHLSVGNAHRRFCPPRSDNRDSIHQRHPLFRPRTCHRPQPLVYRRPRYAQGESRRSQASSSRSKSSDGRSGPRAQTERDDSRSSQRQSLSRALSSLPSRSRSSTFVPQSILKYPPTQVLEEEEKDLIWKFRFYLSRDKMALTKFLKSVSWTDPSEVKQAVETLLPMWTDVEMVDALELLGPGFVDGRVRAYAVKQLERADDDVSLFLSSKPLPSVLYSLRNALRRATRVVDIRPFISLLRLSGTPPLPPPTRPGAQVRASGTPGCSLDAILPLSSSSRLSSSPLDGRQRSRRVPDQPERRQRRSW